MGSEETTNGPTQSTLGDSRLGIPSRQRLTSDLRPLVTPPRPRIVFVLLLTASGLGRWVTAQHRGTGGFSTIFEWILLLTTGVLVGFVGWRLILWEKHEPDDDALVSFGTRRFESTVRLAAGLLFVVAIITVFPLSNMTDFDLIRATAAILAFVAILLAEIDGSRLLYAASAVFGVLVIGATATEHVFEPVSIDGLVRVAHLTAFAIWFGGATWHNVVIIPGIRQFPESKSTLKSHAQRFRPLVLLFIVILLVTGLYQTAAFIGLAVETVLGTTLGIVVCVKLFVLSILSLFPFLR